MQRGGDRGYCTRNYLSPATMSMVDGMRGQLLSELLSRGFAPSLEAASTQAHRADLVRAVLVSSGSGFRVSERRHGCDVDVLLGVIVFDATL